jgi:acetolactate synthase-1/2/3 large subunit
LKVQTAALRPAEQRSVAAPLSLRISGVCTVELSGGEIVMEALRREGVEHIFGYPGGAALHIYDALYQQDAVEHILVRHEQGAVHAADGYARSTGKPGVVLVTSGPGVTNCVTGIATAHMDSIPMVILSGQVATKAIGSDAFQECDAIGITRPCVKHNFLVDRIEDLADVMAKAFYVATSGRPGPVLVDIPKDITAPHIKIPFEYPEQIRMRSYNPTVKGHPGQIRKAVDLLLSAERPMIYSGGGVILSDASDELTALTRELGYPITNTLMGLGAYPATDEQFVGMLGMHGTYEANMAMHECDVLFAIGARFDDRVTGELEHFCPHARIVHIDVDPASISKNVHVDVPIVGDVRHVLDDMLKVVRASERHPDPQALETWWGQIRRWAATDCLAYDTEADVIKPQYVVEKLYELTKDSETYVTSDVGQHQMFAAQFYKFDKPRRWINSGGLGTMGFGLPSAMGVKLAHPDATVVCVTGEASIQMCIQELSTMKQYDLPVVIVNLNNRYMGMVRQWQDMQYGGRYSQSTYQDSLPDFVRLAEAYGHVGIQVTDLADLDAAMEETFSAANRDRLVFLDVSVDPNEHVYPMAVKGGSMRDMFLSKTEQS